MPLACIRKILYKIESFINTSLERLVSSEQAEKNKDLTRQIQILHFLRMKDTLRPYPISDPQSHRRLNTATAATLRVTVTADSEYEAPHRRPHAKANTLSTIEVVGLMPKPKRVRVFFSFGLGRVAVGVVTSLSLTSRPNSERFLDLGT